MFKKGIAFITAVALVTSGIVFTPSNADAAVNSNQGSNSWKLVWSDEFNQTVGQAPDTSVWNYDIGHGSNGWGNNELQRYTDSTNNVYIADLSSDSGSSDGRALAIKAQKEGSEYTSGRIQTQNKQYCKFGRIETKLRVENGSQSGVWPAFWMLGQNYNASGNNWNGAYGASPWPSCGEIDIMEHRNAETQVIGTLHWNPSTTNYEHVYAGSETTNSFGAIDTIENWHTYAIEWYEDCMKWYVDGICYQTMNISSEQMDEFQRDHFIILNLALGSNSSPFTLNQTVSANFTNATMYVDYVRVFQGNDASFSIKNKKEGIAQPETTTNRFSSMTSINNDGNMHNIGQWNYLFAGSWTGTSGYYKGGTDLNDLEVYIGSNNNASEEWGAQLKTNALSLNAGKTYNYSISIESDKAGAEVLLKNDTDGIELQRKTLTNGKNIFAGTITSEKGNAELIFALGKVAAGTTLKVTDFTISVTASILQLILPFLTQSLVDTGIRDNNLSFITLILISQLVIFIAKLSVDFIRSWILLHVNTRINIALISDFLAKLMRLPLHFFDTKMVGDIMQRIGDHDRVEAFMTGTSINTLFSFVNFIVFGFVLAYYDWTILGLFLAGNGLYVAWVLAFMRWRRELDVKRFSQAAGEQSNLFQLITGMQEIKLNNCETKMRWKWERIQVKLFKIGIKGLALQQYQQLGAVFFNQTTNILISFIAARAVVQGDMTLGMMMSVTYIVGQLSSPIEQLIDFSRSLQDAKISLERLGEIHGKEDEEQAGGIRLNVLPDDRTLRLENLSFSYDGADRDYVLEDINLTIPHNRVTAIVGASGSGKTTIVKLLLGFYNPNKGDVRIGDTSLKNLNPHVWRSKTGSVMQDGFIFSDTIANNIAPGEEVVDKERLLHAVTVANIRDFIDSLPLGYNTKIGMEGNGVSQGQRQRILIARAVYKNPDFIFLDEATNALDANNEREIMEQLHAFYKGRTVVVVAHRLSTVRDADKIVVLDKGRVVEEGTHQELTALRGTYYKLVKNQLELGS